MGSRGRLLFDLNEPPTEDEEESHRAVCFHPQKTIPSPSLQTSEPLATSTCPKGITNNNAFSHASTVSGFQPFIRPKVYSPEVGVESSKGVDHDPNVGLSSHKSDNSEEVKASPTSLLAGCTNSVAAEREEGEWTEAECSADANANANVSLQPGKALEEKGKDMMDSSASIVPENEKTTENSLPRVSWDQQMVDAKGKNGGHPEGNNNQSSSDVQDEQGLIPKSKEVKGIEASYALKCANNPGKRKIDEQKEAMHGKKRNRKTMFLNLEDVKQAGPMKTSTPRKQNFPTPVITRIVKEARTATSPAERVGEKQSQPVNEDQKQVNMQYSEGSTSMEFCDPKAEPNFDASSGLPGKPRRLNSETELSMDSNVLPIPRQGSWKQPMDCRQPKNSQFANRKPATINQSSPDVKNGNKKHPPLKKPTASGTSYQDTSVERLIREVTNEKLWHESVLHVPTIITL